MSGDTNLNIILTQGNAIREIQNIRKQDMQLHQQFVSQNAEIKKKEDKSKVRKFDTNNKIEDKEEKRRENKKDLEDNEKELKKNEIKSKKSYLEGNLIDITV